MIGKTLGHYRIVEEIGKGGMGVVYRAHDGQLDRDVAIKVLPAGALADEAARRRFRNEALALAKLSHPNIGVVHDFGTQEGTDYLVMEWIPGAALDEKLAAGALPEKEVAALGVQIAAALEEAHERGVVHRDLKPGNILVTPKGQVKVLDFGLAKLVHTPADAAATVSVTETHGVSGTVPYMSPEQLRGDAVDARADIFAFGVVLYEMAAGKRPFQEDTTPRLTDAILHQAPPPPSRLQPRLSPELERVVLKCLEKDPEDRYQSAKEVRVDLRRLSAPPSSVTTVPAAPTRRAVPLWLTAGAVFVVGMALAFGLDVGGWRTRLLGGVGSPQVKSLAVLPLENLSADREQEYFADGMTEALITELSQIGALRVISRTSVMQYKGARKPLPQIAKELGVDALVEGSVLREGNQVRITVQLVEGKSDRHLWAEHYQRELRGILALQSEVARAIASKIQLKLTPQEQARLASARPVDPEAHEAYLRGLYAWNKFNVEGFQQARDSFEQAIRKDAGYALAYVGLADAYVQLAGRILPPAKAMSQARQAALKALELNPNLGEAHSSLAFVLHYFDWNWTEAEKEYRRAMQLNPGYSRVHTIYAFYLSSRGRFDESLAEIKRGQELDPLALGWKCGESRLLYYARRYEKAIELHRQIAQLDERVAATCYWVIPAYLQKGMTAQAISLAQASVSRLPGETLPIAWLGHAYAQAGRKREALDILRELLALSRERYVSPYNVAVFYTGLGDKDRAIERLEEAVQEHAGLLVYLNVEPLFDPLRSDPRFQALLRRMNLSE